MTSRKKEKYNNVDMPRINIKGEVVHQWYMTFGQQCSISIQFKSKAYCISLKQITCKHLFPLLTINS